MASERLGIHSDCIVKWVHSDIAEDELFEGKFVPCAALLVLAVVVVCNEGMGLGDDIQHGRTVFILIDAEQTHLICQEIVLVFVYIGVVLIIAGLYQSRVTPIILLADALAQRQRPGGQFRICFNKLDAVGYLFGDFQGEELVDDPICELHEGLRDGSREDAA